MLLLARSYYHCAQLRRAEDQLREVIAAIRSSATRT
jgi:hypothetical protein